MLSDLTQARGIGSTIWGWISYPFSWWASESDVTVNDDNQTSIYGLNDNIEIGRRNVTVWCNDQTCTTMRCDKYGCYNTTCNIYDTDMMGECRVYNTITTKPVELTTQAITEVTQGETVTQAATKLPEVTSEVAVTDHVGHVEHPLELEAVLSSTVQQVGHSNSDNKTNKDPSSPLNKVIS